MLPSGFAVRAQPSRKLIFQTKNIANSRKGVNACKETEKKSNFQISNKKMYRLKALRISRAICFWQFFDKNNPI